LKREEPTEARRKPELLRPACTESLHGRGVTPSARFLQRRQFASGGIEKRAAADNGRKISGLCIPYGVETAWLPPPQGYYERYAPGSFGDSLTGGDIRCMFNANVDNVLGRQSARSLQLWESVRGVHFECTLPSTQTADDLLFLMQRGDVDQAGAIFQVLESHFERAKDGSPIRVVTKGSLIAALVSSFSALTAAYAETEEAVANARREGFKAGMAHAQKLARRSSRVSSLIRGKINV
jgi:HK97 family phage prohead protease